MGREMREARQQCGHSCGVEAEKPYTAPAAQAGVELTEVAPNLPLGPPRSLG